MAAFLKRALTNGASAAASASVLVAQAGDAQVEGAVREVGPADSTPASGLSIWCSMVS
jgi:hypothetical protein